MEAAGTAGTSLETQIQEARRRAEIFSQSLAEAREQEAKALKVLEDERARWSASFDDKSITIEQLERELSTTVDALQTEKSVSASTIRDLTYTIDQITKQNIPSTAATMNGTRDPPLEMDNSSASSSAAVIASMQESSGDNQEVHTLTTVIASLQKEIDILTEDKTRLQTVVRDVEGKLLFRNSQVIEFERECDALRRSQSGDQEAVTNLEAHMTAIKNELNMTRYDLELSEAKVETLEKRLLANALSLDVPPDTSDLDRQAEIDALKKSFELKLDIAEREFKAQLASADEHTQQLRSRVLDLDRKCADSLAKGDNYKATAERLYEEKESLQQNVKILEARLMSIGGLNGSLSSLSTAQAPGSYPEKEPKAEWVPIDEKDPERLADNWHKSAAVSGIAGMSADIGMSPQSILDDREYVPAEFASAQTSTSASALGMESYTANHPASAEFRPPEDGYVSYNPEQIEPNSDPVFAPKVDYSDFVFAEDVEKVSKRKKKTIKGKCIPTKAKKASTNSETNATKDSKMMNASPSALQMYGELTAAPMATIPEKPKRVRKVKSARAKAKTLEQNGSVDGHGSYAGSVRGSRQSHVSDDDGMRYSYVSDSDRSGRSQGSRSSKGSKRGKRNAFPSSSGPLNVPHDLSLLSHESLQRPPRSLLEKTMKKKVTKAVKSATTVRRPESAPPGVRPAGLPAKASTPARVSVPVHRPAYAQASRGTGRSNGSAVKPMRSSSAPRSDKTVLYNVDGESRGIGRKLAREKAIGTPLAEQTLVGATTFAKATDSSMESSSSSRKHHHHHFYDPTASSQLSTLPKQSKSEPTRKTSPFVVRGDSYRSSEDLEELKRSIAEQKLALNSSTLSVSSDVRSTRSSDSSKKKRSHYWDPTLSSRNAALPHHPDNDSTPKAPPFFVRNPTFNPEEMSKRLIKVVVPASPLNSFDKETYAQGDDIRLDSPVEESPHHLSRKQMADTSPRRSTSAPTSKTAASGQPGATKKKASSTATTKKKMGMGYGIHTTRLRSNSGSR